MEYELVKELKDAGFKLDREIVWSTEEIIGTDPTLSELIEAVGKSESPFGSIEMSIDGEDGNTKVTCASRTVKEGFIEGNTPEEAVARLFLSLKGAKIN